MARKKVGPKRQAALIRDIFHASRDVVGLAEAHGLSPDELAAWMAEPGNQRCLTGLCVLADMQTQLMLSRYRLVAVTKLIQQATQQEEVSAEQARKACADLLKLDLKRAGLDEVSPEPAEADTGVSAAQLRAMLYGEGESSDSSSQPSRSKEAGASEPSTS
jgi:hypothetical protein